MDQRGGALDKVELQCGLIDGQENVGQLGRVGNRLGQDLDVADRVIADEPEEPEAVGTGIRVGRKTETCPQRPKQVPHRLPAGQD